MSLGGLVLLNIVHQDLETSVHATMVKIEPEASDLYGFSTSFVLAGIDSGVQLVKHLVVTREEGLLKDLCITPINGRLYRRRSYYYACVDWWDNYFLLRVGFRLRRSLRNLRAGAYSQDSKAGHIAE